MPVAPSADASSVSSIPLESCPPQTGTPAESPRTVPLCVSCPSAPRRYRRQVRPSRCTGGGPNQKRKVGQIRVAKSASARCVATRLNHLVDVYFLTNFLTSPRKSDPYTLPSESVVTPSAMLELAAYGYSQ